MTVTSANLAARTTYSLNQRRVKVRLLPHATALLALLPHHHIHRLRLVPGLRLLTFL